MTGEDRTRTATISAVSTEMGFIAGIPVMVQVRPLENVRMTIRLILEEPFRRQRPFLGRVSEEVESPGQICQMRYDGRHFISYCQACSRSDLRETEINSSHHGMSYFLACAS